MKYIQTILLKYLSLILLAIVIISCEYSIDEKNTNNNTDSQNASIDHSETDTDYIVALLKKDVDVETILQETNGSLDGIFNLGDKTYVRIQNSDKDLEYINSLESVVRAEYDQKREIFQNAVGNTPNDARYASQYAPQLTELEQVWATYTGNGVTVAVMDSGVNTLHEDFGGENTFVEGFDYASNEVYGTTHQSDYNSHGTHVAGIIAARKDNGIGITGVAPEATIMPIKAANNAGYLLSFTVANGIKYAVDHGADLINMSFGGVLSNFAEQDAVMYAMEHGVILVAASGNEALELINYPASYPGVIAVGSTNGRDLVSYYSTWNPQLSVSAPGEDIVSLGIGDYRSEGADYVSREYVSKSGTSMATPFVSGLVALLKQKHPTATPAQIKEILETTALDIGDSGYDFKSGYGRVRPKEALAETLPSVEWKNIEFSVSYNTGAVVNPVVPEVNYVIQILNASDNLNVLRIYTSEKGVAKAVLPKGSYKFISSKLGTPYSGTFTLNNDDVSLSKEFSNADFTKNFKVYTFKQTNLPDVDTKLEIMILDKNDDGSFGAVPPAFLTNDNISSANKYSKLDLYRRSNVYYLVTLSANAAGTFNFKIASDIFADIIEEGDVNNPAPTPSTGETYARVFKDQEYTINLSNYEVQVDGKNVTKVETKSFLFYE